MPQSERSVKAALTVLIVLQTVMLVSLYAGVAPHPPAATPLFGIGPFIGAALSAALASTILGPLATPGGRILCCLAVILALVSFGPQKYFDAQIGLIWPAVIAGQAASVVAAFQLFRSAGITGGANTHAG